MKGLAGLQLVVRTGPLKGKHLDLPAEKLSVGRDSTCGLKIDDPKVSRIHGYFEVERGFLYYRDNGSTNGSSVNGRKVARERLNVGDVIQVGASEFALLEQSDFRTIQFVADETMVTKVVNTQAVRADALAEKFASIFDYYKENQPEISPIEQVELVRTQRLLNSLKSLFAVTQQMSQLLPLGELLDVVGKGLFEVFGGAENLVILLYDDDKEEFAPRYVSNRAGKKNAAVTISSTVLHKAVTNKTTLVANDVSHDSRFSASESIVGFSVQAVICAPLVVGERVLGALYLDNRLERVQYDDLDAE
ncbi:FHA domain-containing protein, partial [Candidatus Poribacteria bacterium]|nr:FHA domain-containing protein [Candidatus Poribacteria bacterium]